MRAFPILLLAPGVLTGAPATTQAHRSTKTELAILDELNLARQQPRKYAEFLKAQRKNYRKNGIHLLDGKTRIRTKEGVRAVDEAITYLQNIKPVGKLVLSSGLSRAAEDHAEDIGPRGKVEHTGSDRSTSAARVQRYGRWTLTHGENIAAGYSDPRSIVMQLIIDDGVANRGHRKNIFDPAFKMVGIALRPHKSYRYICVMDFAGGFVEKSAGRK